MVMMQKIDFPGIARAALQQAETLLSSWFASGRRDGHEFKLGSLAGEAGRSLSINLKTGIWKDFASDDGGGDLISLYAAAFGLSQLEAAKQVAGQCGIYIPLDDSPQPQTHQPPPPAVTTPPEPEPEDEWVCVRPVPANAAPYPVAHSFRGRPTNRWEYRNSENSLLGVVCRFTNSTGGKEVLPLTYWRHSVTGAHEWKWRQWTASRPLYGLPALAAKPEAPVLVVEGEKCADAAQAALPDWAVVSWPGGGKAVAQADWLVLAGRQVLLWPDCDAKRHKETGDVLPEEKQPGMAAMRKVAEVLMNFGAPVALVDIPAPGSMPDGWDVADLLATPEGLEELPQWLSKRRDLAPETATAPRPAARAEEPKAQKPAAAKKSERLNLEWMNKLLMRRGEIAACVSNIAAILRHDPLWAGVVCYNEFSQRTVKCVKPPYTHGALGEWSDIDDSWTADWLTIHYGLVVSSVMVSEAVEMLARENSFHPVQDWLKSLEGKWDGVPRLESWLIDCAGVMCTSDLQARYVHAVSRMFLVGMVKRVFEPGAKFDYALVLEGEQGIGKSTIAAVLGGEWYSDTDLDLGHKDSMSALQGKWVHEFSEMGSVARAEAHRHKAFISRQIDEFRPAYGRRQVRCPRQVVFIGTTNESEYVKDSTGARRFWGVECNVIDAPLLQAMREQLFAEAVAAYRAGARCYPTPEEQQEVFKPEQDKRVVQESFVDLLYDYVHHAGQPNAAPLDGFSLAEAALHLKIDPGKLTRDVQTRVGVALHALGCTRFEKRNGVTRHWYKPPQKEVAKVNPPAQQFSGGGDDVPL